MDYYCVNQYACAFNTYYLYDDANLNVYHSYKSTYYVIYGNVFLGCESYVDCYQNVFHVYSNV